MKPKNVRRVSSDAGAIKRNEEEHVRLLGILKIGGSQARWAADEPWLSSWGEPVDVGETLFSMLSEETESVDAAEVGEDVCLNAITKDEIEQRKEVGVAEEVTGARTPGPLEVLCEDERPEVLEDALDVPSAGGASRYARLFSHEELDAMDDCETGQEGVVLAGTEIAVETEEYDKELEERLYPLDEIELKKRVDENAKATEDPSIEEMAKYLEIPPEMLERNRDASPEGSSLPEYWERWYSDTLESSEEGKRANRDFRKLVGSSTMPRGDASSKVLEDLAWAKQTLCGKKWIGLKFSHRLLSCSEAEVVMGASPSMTTAIARRVVYPFLKETKACRPKRKPPKGRLIVNGGTLEVPLKRNKVPELDWRRVIYLVDQVAKALGVIGDLVTVTLPDGFGIRVSEAGDEVREVPRIVDIGRRVVCTVGICEALSSGYIDCLPSQMPTDTGATLSLVSHRVLKRLGRSDGPVKPYEGRVKSSSGHMLRIYGWVHLERKLGSLVVGLDLLVADRLHVVAILGVDALGGFGAVIDVAERKMTLKSSGDVLPLGVMVEHETFMATMATSVQLSPWGQVLVVTKVVGKPDDKAVVLVEGSVGLPPSLCVARTLCTVGDGNVIVELCNASTEGFWVTRGTVVASASVVPDSAFENEPSLAGETSKKRNDLYDEGGDDSIACLRQEKGEGEGRGENVKASKPGVPPDKEVVLEADFSQLKLCDEQKALFQQELNRFQDMFVESSNKRGRTELFEFRIDSTYSLNRLVMSGYIKMGGFTNARFSCLKVISRSSVHSKGASFTFNRSSGAEIRAYPGMYRLNPYLQVNAVLEILSSCIGTFQYPNAMSILKKSLAPLSTSRISSISGIGKTGLTNTMAFRKLSVGLSCATRKFRCYLDKRHFDLYTDHQALTWVFSPGNRTSNSKLARWAMVPSNLAFKVHHKPGKSMGHVDGLSRLLHNHPNAVTMAHLLNPDETPEVVTNGLVGEQGERDGLDIGSEPEVPDEQELPEELADGGSTSDQPMSYVDRFGLDAERFLSEQRMVSWIVAVMKFLKGGALPLDPSLRSRVMKMAPKFDVKEGARMRRVNLAARVGSARSLTVPVVTLPFEETVLHYCHSDLLSSHLGLTKTLEKYAHWPGWHKDVKEYVRECNKCGSGKGSRPWRACRMQRMPVVDLTGLFSLLVVDVIGPLLATERGSKYILVFVDYFTRWAKAFPVESLASLSFVEVMINGVVARHGVPSRLLSDNGTNFCSEVAKSFYQTLGIKKLFGAAYHPQTQGLVERFNGTLIGMLRMHVSEAQYDWDLYLSRVLFAYRTAYHETLGDSPFSSLYGRDLVLPLYVPVGLGNEVGGTEVEPLVEADLPPSGFAERLTLGGEDTIITGVDTPSVELVAKRKMDCGAEYLALTSTYETFWLPRAALIPEYAELVAAFDQAKRKKKGLPELRRSLADTNARVDDEYVLLA
ncbi:unnamed protein product [Phytophthora fragariaefolia]|uniref:Unnamed protein product n=1 Tax=Phytophthora fragariaefolia TaxID=1490495 RepID=A0A9W6Y558_9STRA|nr:unnamed protein product [Phytophthora fragariaefolia]